MISNFRHQLSKVGMENRVQEVLEETGRVRADFGYPIMVTPYSQFVGVQAAMNVILGERYKEVTDEVIQYALGLWGEEESSSMEAEVRDKILVRLQSQLTHSMIEQNLSHEFPRLPEGRIEVKPLDLMINHHTSALFFDGLEIPVENLIGQEGMGFRYIIDGWNAERILIAAEAIGDGRWFIERAAKYAGERVVFGRPIGANQGVQFPIAQAYTRIEAADLVRYQAATLFDRKERCGAEANMAKLLASEAAWEAANVCLTTHGGYGFATEYDVERKFRETRLFTVAPVSNNLVLAYLAQHVLGMPKSY